MRHVRGATVLLFLTAISARPSIISIKIDILETEKGFLELGATFLILYLIFAEQNGMCGLTLISRTLKVSLVVLLKA